MQQFDIGLPNIIPSINLGLTGTITPLKSPPSNLKSLFDFGIAGPLAGLLVSILFLIVGLETTVSGMDAILASSQGLMPVVPVQMLRTSSLVGGLVEFTLGKNTLLPALPLDAVVEMHPFAVAGFVGCIVNSLSLLPLGREYPVD